MNRTTRSLIDEIDARPEVDNRETFDALWGLLGEQFNKVETRFELNPDPSTADLQPYQAPDGSGAGGHLSAFSGPDIDWLIFSWVGNPKKSFTNMHLTISLASKYEAPNLGLAFGTAPHLFWYMDYTPRVDLPANPWYMDKYYAELNEEHLRLHDDPDLTTFISRDLYMRVTQTAASLCFTAPATAKKHGDPAGQHRQSDGSMACECGKVRHSAGVRAPGPGGARRTLAQGNRPQGSHEQDGGAGSMASR